MSRIRANTITNKAATGAPTFSNGAVVTGVCTATTFSGSGASLTSLPAGNLTGTLPAISGANLTGIAGGVTEIDHWIVNTDFNGSVATISNNLVRFEQHGVAKLGTGMSVSSGTWTFPSTGYWMIIAHAQTERNAGHQCKYMQIRTKTTTNNSSYGLTAIADSTYYDNYNATDRKGGCHSQVVFKCTNTSTHKAQFEAVVQDNSSNGAVWSCDSGIFLTGFAFIKFAEI